ncbi:hypothetical protein BN874_2900004 [Candidatus Contendobacter odensis Run_B_J11]|uniref:Uncharacterized protein n=1 Tax=Candidatus Contendobacter odensis Run_B_J11 TaxID=1400861 RepID=A0A7U7J4Z5_9GAMM|nr:hypothetical protein BN874_2900004 [Candidatus Contendobacter odensis Run_B_J11]
MGDRRRFHDRRGGFFNKEGRLHECASENPEDTLPLGRGVPKEGLDIKKLGVSSKLFPRRRRP